MQKGQKLPPVQRHKLTIDLSNDTLEALRELKDGFVLGKGLEGGGTALQGLLSNPTVALAGVVAVLGGILGAQHVDKVVDFFRDLQAVHDATTNETKQEAAGNLIDSMRALIRLFSPLGIFTPLPEAPIPPPEPFAISECQRLETEFQKAKRRGDEDDAASLFTEAQTRGCLWATTEGRT